MTTLSKSLFQIDLSRPGYEDAEDRFYASFPIVAAMPDTETQEYEPVSQRAINALNECGIYTYLDVYRAPQIALSNDELHEDACIENILGLGPKNLNAIMENLMRLGWEFQAQTEAKRPMKIAACAAEADEVSEAMDVLDVSDVTIVAMDNLDLTKEEGCYMLTAEVSFTVAGSDVVHSRFFCDWVEYDGSFCDEINTNYDHSDNWNTGQPLEFEFERDIHFLVREKLADEAAKLAKAERGGSGLSEGEEFYFDESGNSTNAGYNWAFMISVVDGNLFVEARKSGSTELVADVTILSETDTVTLADVDALAEKVAAGQVEYDSCSDYVYGIAAAGNDGVHYLDTRHECRGEGARMFEKLEQMAGSVGPLEIVNSKDESAVWVTFCRPNDFRRDSETISGDVNVERQSGWREAEVDEDEDEA
ncbi:hypothetical protein [Aureimonas glaciei]|uniref:Uncharacterized protein n=1 Tax=Aureimonas glaciei TaxID=1776957 RepID=A0A916Y5Y6_9HYPH|nr:hypothetical protein [Aureimonas glaciei]GGD31518.1 hypothetical protein GCM10011335_38190 [Aureimonas glaciei]